MKTFKQHIKEVEGIVVDKPELNKTTKEKLLARNFALKIELQLNTIKLMQLDKADKGQDTKAEDSKINQLETQLKSATEKYNGIK